MTNTRRVIIKLAIMGVVIIVVLFPNPRLLVRHIGHVADFDAMVEPDAPEMAQFEKQFHDWVAAARPAKNPAATQSKSGRRTAKNEVHQLVQEFVYQTVQYEWDWNLWGSADYLPTVSEIHTLARETNGGQLREDCDGRAVLAASLLRRLGYPARMVTDFGHVWVETNEMAPATQPGGKPTPGARVELMGPGRVQAIKSSDHGNSVTLAGLANVPRALAYGIAVFPWGREAIIFATGVILLLHRRASKPATIVGILFALAGWQLLRTTGEYWTGDMWNAWLGVFYTVGGAAVLYWAGYQARKLQPSRQQSVAPPLGIQ